MNIRALRTLVAIHDNHSFHMAARKLNLTTTTVSMQIKSLETELDVALFDRSQRPPTLTPTGLAIVKNARELVALEADIRQLARTETQPEGQVHLGVISSAAIHLLPDALVNLYRDFPQIRVQVHSDLSDVLQARVLGGEADAVIITQPDTIDRRLVAKTISEEPLVLVQPKTWDTGNSLEVLADVPFIRFDRRTGIGTIVDKLLKAKGIETREHIELNSLDAILRMVAKGLGASIVPIGSLRGNESRDIVVTRLHDPEAVRRVAFVTRIKNRKHALTSALLKVLLST